MTSYHKGTTSEVLDELETSQKGLSEEEANIRVKKYGLNKLMETKRKSLFIKFIEQFKDLTLIILLIAAFISGTVAIITGEESLTDSIIIFFVVILNAILGLIQENKAEKAIEALKTMSTPYIKCRREGKIVSVKVEELTIGDIVLLEAGDYIPADMRIIESHSLKVEEAAITGESLSVEKTSREILEESIAIADRKNMAYTGSSVVYGRAEGVVVSVGMDTELGKIAKSLVNQKTESTPLQKKMNELSKVLTIAVLVIALIMFIVGIAQGNQILDVFMLAISLAVAAVPEGLSAVITITLAIGVQKMAKENAIVRKLSAVETLGATEVICTDKTGTLTQNKMKVRKVFFQNCEYEIENEEDIKKLNLYIKNKSEEFGTLVNGCVLCNDTKFGEDNGNKVMLGDPTEVALVDFCELFDISKEKSDEMYERIDEIPFDSERKMMSTLNNINAQRIMYTKGATESIIENCTKILINGKIEEITREQKENIINQNKAMAKEALRVLAFAYKPVKKDEKLVEDNMIFVSLIGMIDAPRKDAKKAVERCFNAGMTPVMITGDNIDTAVAIAKELGILKSEDEAITGVELDRLSDEEFESKVKKYRVYARVSPENKVRIVKAWKKLGKVVAMTGDGVNDAPAIKGADIGIGMGITGTEVSKSVASMVLVDDNFATIVLAVKEGRRIYSNIQNAIAYLLASNLAEVIIVFMATLLNKTILLPIQILWINLVTDTIPAIALGFEREEKDIMRRKPRKAKEKFFNPFFTFRVVVPGILKSLIVFVVYLVVNNAYSEKMASTAVFITLSVIEILFAIVCRSDKKSIFKIGLFSNKIMLLCIVGTLIIQGIVIFTPAIANLLKIAILPTNLYIMIGIVCILTMILFDIIKIINAKIFLKK